MPSREDNNPTKMIANSKTGGFVLIWTKIGLHKKEATAVLNRKKL